MMSYSVTFDAVYYIDEILLKSVNAVFCLINNQVIVLNLLACFLAKNCKKKHVLPTCKNICRCSTLNLEIAKHPTTEKICRCIK